MISLFIYGALSMLKALWGTTQKNDFTILLNLEI